MRMAKCLLAVLLVFLFKPALGQELTLKDILNGRIHATSIPARNLNSHWYKIRVTGKEAKLSDMVRRNRNDRELQSGWFFTQGDVVTVGKQKFLIAYQPAPSKLPEEEWADDTNEDDPDDPQAVMELYGHPYDSNGNLLPQRKLKPDEILTLSLLDLKTSGNMEDIQSFDVTRDMEKPLTPQAKRQAETRRINQLSNRNLKQIGLAMLQYMQDYDEVLPPMRTVYTPQQFERAINSNNTRNAPVQALLQPYVRSTQVFMHPTTRELYRPNPILSRKKWVHIANPESMVAFYEPRVSKDGTRGVLFLDGHVERVNAKHWERLKRASKIPP